MKKLSVLLLFIFSVLIAGAQTTAVTATVTDSDGTAWINAPYTITFVGSKPGQPSVSGQPFTQTFSGTTNGTGVLSQTITDVGFIAPAQSTWRFTITPAVTGAHSVSVNVPVTGASQDISAQINAVIVAPRLSGGIGVQAYADVEVTATSGNTYYRVTDNAQRCYTTSWTGCGGSGGGATTPATTNVLKGNGTVNGVVAATPGTDYVAPALTTTQNLSGPISILSSGTFISTATNTYVNGLLNGCNPQTEFAAVQFQNGLTSGLTGCVTGPAAGSGVYQMNGVSGFVTTNDANAVGGYLQARPLANNSHAWGANTVVQDVAGLTTGVVMNSIEADIQAWNPTTAYSAGSGILAELYTPGANLGTYNFQAFRVVSSRAGAYWAQGFRVDRAAIATTSTALFVYPGGSATNTNGIATVSNNVGGPNTARALLNYWNGSAGTDEDFDLRPDINSGTNPTWDGWHFYHNGGPAGQFHHIYIDPTMDWAIAHTDGTFSTITAATGGNGADQIFLLPVIAGSATLATTGGLLPLQGVQSVGTKFTTSGCSISATTGGATAGTFTLGVNSCTAIVTMNGATGATANNGWSCAAHDRTAPTVLIGGESSSTTTTASFTIPAGAGATDVISFSCTAF